MTQSPFDRRHRMASVRVDTAGAGDASHRVDIPYLPVETGDRAVWTARHGGGPHGVSLVAREGGSRSLVVDAQLGRDCRQPWVGGPQTHSTHQGGCEQVRINPADAAAVKPVVAHELHHLTMWHRRRLVHQKVVRQQLLATSSIADEELAEDEVMATDFPSAQKGIQLAGCPAPGSTGIESRPRYRRAPSGGRDASWLRPRHAGGEHQSRPARVREARALDRKRPDERSASSPSLTGSVSVLAPLADRASPRRFSSLCSVFFMPYDLPVT